MDGIADAVAMKLTWRTASEGGPYKTALVSGGEFAELGHLGGDNF